MTEGFVVYDIDDEDVLEIPSDSQSYRFGSPSSDVVILDSPPIKRVYDVNEAQPESSNQPQNLLNDCFPRVLEIVPDVDHDHLRNLLEKYRNCESIEQCIQSVLHALFEDLTYPRNPTMTMSNKRRRSSDSNTQKPAKKLKRDFSSIDRPPPPGLGYFPLALLQLQIDYPFIPKQHIRTVLARHRGLYAPSYIFLDKESKDGILPYCPKKTAFRPSGKDKAMHDLDFQEEREWLVEYLNAGDKPTAASEVTAEEDEDAEDSECEDGIDCACCFSKYAFDRMIQCPEAHLFCRMCCRRYAAIQLGQHDHLLVCMDQSNCKQPFPESELARFLSPKLLQLYHRLKQQKEITEASIDGLEECPFCEYKVVIENPDERLFRCEAEDCMAITCRQCKKLDHLPKNCQEVEADAALDVRHTLEEAMTKAMMRNCPKCQKSFIKESGCNKITCYQCSTMSCYICRQIITGYEHFNDNGRNGNRVSSKCPLWDNTESRHDQEVKETAERIKKQLQEQNPDLPDGTLDVDIPKINPNLLKGEPHRQQQQFQDRVAVMQAHMQIQRQHAFIAQQMQMRQQAQRPYVD